MTLAQTIAQCKRELRQDPASLRFVQLAEALRKLGRFREAEEALADGLLSHPGLNSARLVLARVYADTNRRAEALTILDELYPKDSGNVLPGEPVPRDARRVGPLGRGPSAA